MASKLLLAGYYGFDNSGDDAILKSMVESIKKDSHPYEIKVLSNNPKQTTREYGVECVNRFSFKELNRAMEKTDVFVFGGGSLLQDVTSTRSLVYYLSLIRLAKFHKKKVFIFANGIGPINSSFNRKLTKKTLDKVDVITLRDRQSLLFVEKLNVTNKNIYLTADPVFMLDKADEDRVDAILELEKIKLGKNTLAISLRHWPRSEDLHEIFTQFCDNIVDYDIDIVLLPMHYPYDLDYLKKIKDKTVNERVHLLKNKYQVEEIIGILSRCQISIAMRLHGVIYSAIAQTPTIGLVYDPKVYGLAKELNVDEYISVEDVDLDILNRLFVQVVENIDKKKEDISISGKIQKSKAYETLDHLRELVDNE